MTGSPAPANPARTPQNELGRITPPWSATTVGNAPRAREDRRMARESPSPSTLPVFYDRGTVPSAQMPHSRAARMSCAHSYSPRFDGHNDMRLLAHKATTEQSPQLAERVP